MEGYINLYDEETGWRIWQEEEIEKEGYFPQTKMGSIAGDKSSAPRFVQKPQLRQEDEGNRLIFECELGGFPQPEVFWFREDTQITEDQRTNVKVTPTDKKTFVVVLELNDVVESDAGLYKIRSKNKFGEVAASINLNFSRKYFTSHIILKISTTFYGKLRLYFIFLLLAIDAPSLPQVDGIAPTFSTKPTIRQGPDGTTLIFHCAIVADPKPQITWYHDGVKVSDGGKFQVLRNIFTYT